MKRWIIGAASALGIGVLALLGDYAYLEIGLARGEQWASLNGPAPVWPAVVGFSAMYLIPISALVLILLVGAAIVRSYLPGSAVKTGRSSLDRAPANGEQAPG